MSPHLRSASTHGTAATLFGILLFTGNEMPFQMVAFFGMTYTAIVAAHNLMDHNAKKREERS